LTDEQNEIMEKEANKGPEAETEKSLEGSQEMGHPAAEELEDKLAALKGQVEDRAGVIADLKGRLTSLGCDFEGAKAAYAYAVEDYKRLAASSNPLIPIEAISGATIEEVKESLHRARKLVANVQSSLMEGAVPAGAPARAGLDISAMSTKEKINYGLEQARKKKD
jgi:hypothetical protein